MDQQQLYDVFMPPRVQAFLDGVNATVMAYGQTGSGKTHTIFGPPGIMARAATGDYGDELCDEYGIFPRGILHIYEAVDAIKQAGAAVVLTASVVELASTGNRDLLATETRARDPNAPKFGGAAMGVALDQAADPPRLYGMTELPLDSKEGVRQLYAGTPHADRTPAIADRRKDQLARNAAAQQSVL